MGWYAAIAGFSARRSRGLEEDGLRLGSCLEVRGRGTADPQSLGQAPGAGSPSASALSHAFFPGSCAGGRCSAGGGGTSSGSGQGSE